MSNSNGKITAPIDIETDIYKVLGLSATSDGYDLGYACSNKHGKIKKWARYKPVILDAPFVDDNFNSATGYWDEKKTNIGKWSTNRAWIFGSKNYPVFDIKQISNFNDYGKDGTINQSFQWAYQAPWDSFYYRITDFLGYSHTGGAACPVRVDMDSEILFNQDFYAGLSMDYDYKDVGGYDFSEISEFFYFTKLYVGICIVNRTKKFQTLYVKTGSFMDDPDNGMFRLTPSSGANIKDGGFGHKMDLRDKIDVYLFYSSMPGSDLYSADAYSAYMDKDIPYMQYTVGYKSIIVKVPYTLSNMSINIIDLNRTLYINDYDMGGDGNYCTITRYISAVYGKLTVEQTANSDYSQFRVYLGGYGTVTNSKGETGTVQATVPVTYRTLQNGNFKYQNYTMTLNGTESMSFKAYPSLNDLHNGTNALTYYGCPIYDTVILNNVDADLTGNITKREIGIYCSGASSLDWYYLVFTDPNEDNIIYRD